MQCQAPRLMCFLCLLISGSTVCNSVHSAGAAEQNALWSVQSQDAALVEQLQNKVAYHHQFEQVKGLFNRTSPADPATQLWAFGALQPWPEIRRMLNSTHKLVLLVRHAQAWENLNPGSNTACDFPYTDPSTNVSTTIVNWDSAISPKGEVQATSLHADLADTAPPSQTTPGGGITWADAIGLSNAPAFVSPQMRTLQTAHIGLKNLLSHPPIASSLLRASLGGDVCNARHRVWPMSPGEAAVLPVPWNTTCAEAATAPSLSEIFGTEFLFKIRPPGDSTVGIVTDHDSLWRSDFDESDASTQTRARAFLAQVFESTEGVDVVVVVTHGEMVSAFGDITGESMGAANTQVVPMVVRVNHPTTDNGEDD